MQTIFLPIIESLILENFSLYSSNFVKMDFSKSVSCIMGANGIGKSTLLNCINYAITGRINPPDKKLKSIEELDVGNNYYQKYFDGRISEIDKEFASSTVTFYIGENRFSVKRIFFPEGQIKEYSLNGRIRDNSDYKTDIVKFSKLNNYAQFVFLQLKILTFDESRDCLFWNPSVLTPTIFLCLGKNVEHANRADELARELQKINSRIRNVQWDITKQSTRLTTLIEERDKTINSSSSLYSKEDEANAKNEYAIILENIEKVEAEKDGYINEQQLIYAKTAEYTLQKLKFESEYEHLYSQIYSGDAQLWKSSPLLIFSGNVCPICNTKHTKMPERIEMSLSENICPLCGEHVSTHSCSTDTVLVELQQKDEQIREIGKKLEEIIKRKDFIDTQIDALDNTIVSLIERKEQIETNNYRFLLPDNNTWDERIDALKTAITQIETEKKNHIEHRDRIKAEYDDLCHNLENIYQDVQVNFLPTFKKYAKEFTGLDLDMTLNSISDDGRRQFKFILLIDDTNRDNEFELSESQRFFIDIALRMAIVSFVCKNGFPSSMLIDTPEGALDIAYETNAGSMFFEYVKSMQKMIITANLNSSGLIKTLASQTKHEKFALINMLKWAKLSSVQNLHFELFTSAINDIEKRLEE